MTKRHLLGSLIVIALVIVLFNTGGIANTFALAQAPNTPRPTRDRTANPRQTKTPQAAEATGTPDADNQGDVSAPELLSSRLLVVNPGSVQTARVTVNMFDSQGSTVYSDTMRIKPNGVKLINVPKELGNDFLGSARIVSNQRVQALVLDSNVAGSANDVYEVTNVTSNTLVLPVVQHDAASSEHSLIAVQNTSALSAEATFTALDTDGNEILAQALTIAPRASAYLDTRDLFGANDFLGSARITADQRVAAVELSAFGQGTASVRALVAEEASPQLIVPMLERRRNAKRGMVVWSLVYVRNNGDAPTDITLRLFTEQGDKKANATRASVPAGGLAVFDLRADEFKSLGKKFIGWARAASTDKTPLAASAFVARARGKQWNATGAVARARVKGRSVCGDVRVTAKQTAILTLLNPNAREMARVKLNLYAGEDGAPVAEMEREIGPNGQIRITSANGLPNDFRGIAIVSTDAAFAREVVAAVLTQTRDGKRVTATRGYVCP
jgi:hypothetical protein